MSNKYPDDRQHHEPKVEQKQPKSYLDSETLATVRTACLNYISGKLTAPEAVTAIGNAVDVKWPNDSICITKGGDDGE